MKEAIRLRIGSGIATDYGKLDDLFVGKTPNEIFLGKVSHLDGAGSIHRDTFFDLASLTKILATTTLAMTKYESGSLHLDETLASLLPEQVAINNSLAPITVAQLLSHTSGLPAWNSFFESMKTHFGEILPYVSILEREKYFSSLLFAIERIETPAAKVVYSDLGFLILEKVLSSEFEKEVMEVWSQNSGSKLHFRPVCVDAFSARQDILRRNESISATEECPWRGLLQGQVHDDNAWTKGGIAGHAGVFGRLSDVQGWMKTLFSGQIVSNRTLRTFMNEVNAPYHARRGLGFDMPALDGGGSTGFSFSKNSVGHLGFTGTSVWVDLDTGDYSILLTNRVHPNRDDLRIRLLRREFHALAREFD